MNVSLEILKLLVPLFITAITVFGTLFTKYYLDNKKLIRDNKALTIKVRDHSIFIQYMFRTSGEIANTLSDILTHTKATRVILFSASNGSTELKYCNSLFGLELIDGKITITDESYKALEFDKDYNQLLYKAEKDGDIIIDVSTMPTSLLKDIYKSIGITHSIVKFTLRCKIDALNDRIFYPSIATRSTEPFTTAEKFYIKKKNDELKDILKNILNKQQNITTYEDN